jgi:Zn-dependent protease with chaperone function
MFAPILATGVILAILFSGVYQLVVGVTAGMSGAAYLPALVTAGIAVVYFGAAVLAAYPSAGEAIDLDLAKPEYHALVEAYRSVCEAAGLKKPPRLAIRNDACPNLRSKGLWASMSCIYANSGLLAALPESRELKAVLAHEVVHIKRLDNVYFSLAKPTLSVAFGLAGTILLVMRRLKGRA